MGLKIFRDVTLYHLTKDYDVFTDPEDEELNWMLEQKKSRQPGSQELGHFGFVEPVGEEGSYVEKLSDGALLITAQQWKRDLPASVVKRELDAKIRKIEKEEQRKVYSKERNQLKDEIIQKLLPRAFVKGKRVSVLIKGEFVFIDTASAKLAESVLSLLREAIGTLGVRPVTMKHAPTATMTNFFRTGECGMASFELGESFVAKGTNDEASTLSGKAVDLSEDDIKELLEEGRQVTALGLRYADDDETVYFAMTEDFVVKGIVWPDSYVDDATNDAGEEADAITLYRATLLLVSQGLGNLFRDLVQAFGGESRPGDEDADFEERMRKAEKAILKNVKNYSAKSPFKLGDSNLATDFNLDHVDKADALRAALDLADADDQDEDRAPTPSCPDNQHTYLGNSKTGAISPKCVDCGHPYHEAEPTVVDDEDDLI